MSGDFQASMRRLLWFLIGILIAAVWLVPSARAETCSAGVCTQPATVGSTVPAYHYWKSVANIGPEYAAAAAMDYARLCGTRAPSGTLAAEPTNLANGAYYTTGQYCVIGGGHYNATVSHWATCNTTLGGPGGTMSGGAGSYVCTLPGYYCPSTGGWTLSGTNCTRPACAEGETRQPDGTCLKPCKIAENDQVDPGGYYEDTGHGAEVTDCVQGCRVYIGGKIFKEAGKTYGQAWSYGTPCTGSTTPGVETTEQDEACAKRGLCGGTFNGKQVCTACDETSQTTKTTKTETPEGGGTPVTTTTTTTEICKESGSCTTTTTTSSSSGASSTTTTTKPGGTASGEGITPGATGNCDTDASAIECANSAYEAALCSAEPVCSGDAVQCAQALEVWKTRCEVLKALTPDVADDAPISGADATEASRTAYQEQMDTIKDQITGALPDPSADSKSAWESALSTGWFDAITITGCTAQDYAIGPYIWHFDPCPTAEKISDIGSYALWLSLVIGGFVFVTGGRNAGMSH